MSNSLDPDQARLFVGPDLGPNCWQRLSADDTGTLRVNSHGALLSAAVMIGPLRVNKFDCLISLFFSALTTVNKYHFTSHDNIWLMVPK